MRLDSYDKWITLAMMDEVSPSCFVAADELTTVVEKGKSSGILFAPTCHYFSIIFNENGQTHHRVRADKKKTRWTIEICYNVIEEPFYQSSWCPLDQVEQKFDGLSKEYFNNW